MPPISGMGIRNPNSARLGIVCTTLANPRSHRRARGRRVNRIPIGTPIRIASAMALPTSTRCSPVSRTMSRVRSERICLRRSIQARQKGARFLGLNGLELAFGRDYIYTSLNQQRDPASQAKRLAHIVGYKNRGLREVALQTEELILQL